MHFVLNQSFRSLANPLPTQEKGITPRVPRHGAVAAMERGEQGGGGEKYSPSGDVKNS